MKISTQTLFVLVVAFGLAGVLAESSTLSTSSSEDSLPASLDEEELAESNSSSNEEEEVTAVMIFNTGNRRSGWTYEETFAMNMTSELDMMGRKMVTNNAIEMDAETTPTDLPQGGQEVHMTITRLAFATNTGMINMGCDTAKTERDEAEQFCDAYYDLLTDFTFVVDDKGLVAESSQNDKMVKMSASAEHLKATARLLAFIPARPVQKGESWDASEDLDGLGYFEGSATFLGEDKENHCVIFSVVGDLEIDFKELTSKMGDHMKGLGQKDTRITDSRMSAKVCWDSDAKMPTWTETDSTLTLRMTTMEDEEIDMPIRQVYKTTCAVKDKGNDN